MSFVKFVFILATVDITSMAYNNKEQQYYHYADVGYMEKCHIKHGNFFLALPS
jgi:hypothetical protein